MKLQLIIICLFQFLLYGRQIQQHDEQIEHLNKDDHLKTKIPGSGIVNLIPSICIVTFAIEIQHSEAKEALEMANEKMSQALKYLKTYLDEKDQIQTGVFQLSIRYDYSSGNSIIIGYTVTNQIIVTTKNLEQTGQIITAGVEAGLNRIDSVSYSNSDNEIEQATDKATVLAIQQAKRKSELIAKSLDMKFAKIIDFEFSQPVYAQPYGPVAKGETAVASAGAIPTPIFAQKQSVRVDVLLKVLFK